MLYVCADDYGMTEESCSRIEDCAENGALNKISIFPNSGLLNLDERIQDKNLRISIHINLVEGKPLSSPEDVSLLVSDNGRFKWSFGGLLLLSLSSKRKTFERQIYKEIRAQIKNCMKFISPDSAVAIDSHQHTHMIPLIFKVLMQVISDEGINADYIRVPSEPVMPYLFAPSLYFTYKPANIAKQWVLKFLGSVNKKELEKSGINTAYFMGILFSGKMDEKRVNKVLPHYQRLAQKNGKDIEILFHPGYLKSGENVFDEEKKSFKKFYFSKGRKIEFDTVKRLKVDKNTTKEECNECLI